MTPLPPSLSTMRVATCSIVAVSLVAVSLVAVSLVAAPAAAQTDEDRPGQTTPGPDGSSELEPELLQVEPTFEEAHERETEQPEAEQELRLRARISGEYRHRVGVMSDVPLTPLPRTDPVETGRLGLNVWGEQWLRARGEISLDPVLRLFGEADVLWGVAYGDTAIGQGPAAWSREEYGYPGLRLRQLYLDWLTPIGLVRLGQMSFSWGLGMVSNGGNSQPVFGDYRYGDLVRRLLFATKPAGRDSPFTIAVSGDWVAYDLIADFERRGDLAFQGVIAGFYEDEEEDDRVGAYVAYRNQVNELGDNLELFVADLFTQFHYHEPSGGQVLAAFEAAYVRGTTTIPRTVEHPVHEVEQLMILGRLGRVADDLDLVLEAGYASGDENAEDAFQRRATFDPDRRVGLILFPEVIAAQTARSAALAGSPETFGRPARGIELLPTNGGVAGAYYLFPYLKYRPTAWLELRLGGVVAWSSTDVVDPYAQRALSRRQNYRGGDPTRRDLGFEIDGSVLLHGPLAEGITVSGGVEGGGFFPGHAFDDANGQMMDPVGLLRVRFGLSY